MKSSEPNRGLVNQRRYPSVLLRPPSHTSGSETDVSTSNENLSTEERFLLRSSERQDPQGEEETGRFVTHHHLSSPHPDKLNPSVYAHKDPLLFNKLLIRKPNMNMTTSSGAYFDPKGVSNKENSSGHSDYTSSDIISQLTREMRLYSQAALSGLPVPPKMEPLAKKQLGPDKQLLILSRSQPDLHSSDSDTKHDILSPPLITPNNERGEDASRVTSHASTNTVSTGFESNAALLTAIESYKDENTRLKRDLDEMNKKVTKVAQLEMEMSNIHESYQGLLKHSEKREALEKNARSKLQGVIQSLSEANKEVTERHEAVMQQLMSGDVKNQNIPGLDAILRSEIMRKDSLINQLMNQNKMFISSKERQDVEMNAQRETLEEQRQHIKILDSALSNAQASVLRLEEENRMKEGYADRVKQMTKSLEQLQAASEKRETMEKKLRAKLEEELKTFRIGFQSRLNSGDDCLDDLQTLHHKVIRLESERTHWEQRYLEEAAMRQVAIDAASIPKDAKIAALEKNSVECEKIITEARSDKMRQFEEVQNTHRKCAELETLVKTLETQLAERDAIIRLIQSQQRIQDGPNTSMSMSNPVVSSVSDTHHSSLIVGTPISSTSVPMIHNALALPPPSPSPNYRTIYTSPSGQTSAVIAQRHAKQLSTPLLASPLIGGTGFRLPGTNHPMIPSVFPPRSSSEVMFKSGLASRSLTPSDLFGRSLTPTAELLRSTPTSVAELKANAARRDSMPGNDVLSFQPSSRHSSPVPNSIDIYSATSAADSSIMSGGIGGFIGGTLPKMALKTETSSRAALASGKFTNNPAFNILMDDSISSIVGSMTPTRIDSNPAVAALANSHNAGRRSPRHEPLVIPSTFNSSSSGGASGLVASVTSATTADGTSASKSYMEVWNV
ncbi:uncharacterized protein [Lepeophtheirus salmonis]|uniref:uncharacterized protein isoform X3 n=1 Tax=Lepeophtheirus salmonis TaxID=72036 RepID=UPI001AE68DA0|nr:angiomotin-like 2a isoform X3 [Lepeophtheirus salmonis]